MPRNPLPAILGGMTESFLLSGGDVVTAESVTRADILIDGESIAAVGPHLDAPANARRIDVTGLTVLPGLIDAHTHLREPGATHKEDYTTGTQAALAGGVTTVFAMPNTDPPIVDRESFEYAASLAEAKAICDVGLYIGATPDNAQEAASLADRAVGLKMYMGSSTGSLLVDDFAGQISHFETYPQDRVLAVHAEDEEAVQYYAARGEHRPPICAALATSRAIALVEQTARRMHICHVSTPYELQLIANAKARGASVTCEVGPHHLFLDRSTGLEAGYARVNPPLRAADDAARLWDLLPIVDLIATDHAPHLPEEKESLNPPSGLPGLETSLALLLTAAHDGCLSLSEIARLTTVRPAEAFSIPRKGRIAPGYNADLTLVDLAEEWTLSRADLFTKCGWSPFEEQTFHGRVKQTYLRGQLAFDDGRILVEPGCGQLVSPA